MSRVRDFRGADLAGEDLREAHLAGADLTGARLDRARLDGVDLQGTVFREASLDGVEMRDARLRDADLSSASLRDAHLGGSQLVRSDLSLAELAGADLRHADLTEANLTDASLARARCDRASFRDANLTGAGLRGASLREAILAGANLREVLCDGADFRGARFAFTVLAASDWSRAHGLEAVRHDGPSTVGIDAFLWSRGQIPDAFLEGAGIGKLTIEYLKSVAAAEEGMLVGESVFLRFADEDRGCARRLRACLRMHGVACDTWSEREDVRRGSNVDLSLRVRFHERTLVLWSGADLPADDGAAAISEAFAVRLRGAGGAPVPDDRVLADFTGVDWNDPEDPVFHRELRRLVASLRR